MIYKLTTKILMCAEIDREDAIEICTLLLAGKPIDWDQFPPNTVNIVKPMIEEYSNEMS